MILVYVYLVIKLTQNELPKQNGPEQVPIDATDHVATPSTDVKNTAISTSIFEKVIDEVHKEDFHSKLLKSQIVNYDIMKSDTEQALKPCSNWGLPNRFLMIIQNSVNAMGIKQLTSFNRRLKENSSPVYINVPNIERICNIDNHLYSWKTYRDRLECPKCNRTSPYRIEKKGFKTISNIYDIKDAEIINPTITYKEVTNLMHINWNKLEKIPNIDIANRGIESQKLWDIAEQVNEIVNERVHNKESQANNLSRTVEDSNRSRLVVTLVALCLSKFLRIEDPQGVKSSKVLLERYLQRTENTTQIISTRIFKAINRVGNCLDYIFTGEEIA